MTTIRRQSLLVLVTWLAVTLQTQAFAPHTRSSARGTIAPSMRPLVHQTSPASRGKASSTSLTQRSMLAVGTPVIGALAGAISGGLLAGSLHAIAGPDHLAALLPRCCGQRWYRAGRVGALWGMGHGVSATLIGLFAFGLKSTLQTSSTVTRLMSGFTHVMELAIGLSLILIGVMGIREAREWRDEIESVQPQTLSAAAADPGIKAAQKRAVVFNGLLHGFSWDGAPSLAPAVAVATWGGSLAFLASYAVGTMTTMAIVTTLIGEGTRKAGQFFQRPDIPQKLSFGSSILAIVIGVVWCGLGLV